MRRDLTRDLRVLDRLKTPDLLEEAERRALDPVRGPELDPGPSRRRAVTASLAVVVVGLAIATFLWLSSAFRATPAGPAEPAGPNYVFTNVRPHAGETDGDGNIMIRFEVAWPGTESPGLHRCRFQALDSEGAIVSELERLIAFEPAGNVAMDIPPPTGEVAGANAACDPERLDTPGITELVPLDPADVGRDLDRWLAALPERVDRWAARFEIESMSVDQLVWNIEALSSSTLTGRFAGDAQAWAWHEWALRRERLCRLLPKEHAMRAEGCSRSSFPS